MWPSCCRICSAVRRGAWLTCLPLLACTSGGGTGRAPTDEVTDTRRSCWLILIPAESDDLADWAESKQRFEQLLLDQAGGFTDLGRCRGVWRHEGQVLEENNLVYFVVGPPSLGADVRKLIRTRFGQREPFVVSW